METPLKFVDSSGCTIGANQIVLHDGHDYSIQISLSGFEYRKLEANSLFGFSPSIVHYQEEGSFDDAIDVDIWLTLEPDLQRNLKRSGVYAKELMLSLQEFSQNAPEHLLLHTESWLLLAARQNQQQKTIGYKTVWDYFDWSLLISDESQDTTFDQAFPSAIASFVQAVVSSHTQLSGSNHHTESQVGSESIKALLQGISCLFSELDIDQNRLTEDERQFPDSNLLDRLIDFLKAEDWVIKPLIEHPSVLFLGRCGELIQWNCYAQVREAEHQVIFYSVSSQKAPKRQRLDVAEFITRANYGLVLGNFEMDFSDGEIRYKTSIGVEASSLTAAIFWQLVYSNLLITDKYSLGLQKVLEGMCPTAAIAQIENSTQLEPSSGIVLERLKKSSLTSY